MDRLKQAEAAQDAYRRVCRLFGMDATELRALLSGDQDRAAPWVESAARHGVVEAQLRLGQMLLDGAGLPRDEAAALAWFTRAADKGSAEAMNMIGRCHENGWGVEPDPAAAAGWYRRSAEAGHDRAMNLLGRCLEEGWGVARSPAEARDWYRRSAEAGYFRGQYNHATCLAVRGEVDAALAWFEAACRGASPGSRRVMTRELEQQADSRLSALGRRLGQAPACAHPSHESARP